MLRDVVYRHKRRRLWIGADSRWIRGFLGALIGLIFLFIFVYSIQHGSSRQLVKLLSEQRFPFEAVLLEGAPGLSQPQRNTLDSIRNQGISLGMFLLTGVNITDTRTYFLSYFAPPPNGPAWISWAYYPDDPEMEGLSLERLAPETPFENSGVNTNTPISKEVKVGIYHTHNSESYSGSGGPEREPGKNGEVVEAGEALKHHLERLGIKTYQSMKIHDDKDFYQAYSHSLSTATQILKDYPSTKLLLDIHRDGKPPGVSKSTVIAKGKDVARVMVVIGKVNPNWKKNEAIAKELIEIGESKFPGLFVSNISYAADARYNQHLADGALLLEFGSQLNSFEEIEGTAEALAEVIGEWFRRNP